MFRQSTDLKRHISQMNDKHLKYLLLEGLTCDPTNPKLNWYTKHQIDLIKVLKTMMHYGIVSGIEQKKSLLKYQ